MYRQNCTNCANSKNCKTVGFVMNHSMDCSNFVQKSFLNKWDARMLEKAKLVASWSKDPDHKVGAVITIDNKTVSEGFNGPPKGVIDHDLPRKMEVWRTLHAEINAIIFAAAPLKGATIYVYPFHPCAACAAAIIQAGITRVIYSEDTNLPTWQASQTEAKLMFEEAGVDVFKAISGR